MDTDVGEELCLIDSGIDSIARVPIRPSLTVINLHCNAISRIERLEGLHRLRHLDLSSNQIQWIQGLDGLSSLRTLNLSCNQIEVVDGLKSLKNLVKLNISHNQIVDLSGFGSIQGPQYKLSQVELQGNLIESLQSICVYLRGCTNLRHLALCQGGVENPVCSEPDYWRTVISSIPMIEVLDGRNREGVNVGQSEVLADIPGLEGYLDILQSNESSSDPNPIALATPRIDAVIDAYKQKGATTPEVTTTSELDSSHHEPSEVDETRRYREQGTPSQRGPAYESRIETLERQLAELLSHKKPRRTPVSSHGYSPKASKIAAKRDVDETDESENDIPSKTRPNRSKGPAQSRIPGRQKATTSTAKKTRLREARPKTKSSTSTSECEGLMVRGRSPERVGTSDVRVIKSGRPTAIAKDERLRDDVQATYVNLMKELETERERRWKAEQASKKLVDVIKTLHTKAKDEHSLNEAAIDATNKLKLSVTNERESRLKLQAENELLQEELGELKGKFEESQEEEGKTRKALVALQDTASQREREHLQQQAHEAKRLQEAQMKGAGTSREVDLLRSSAKTLKDQVHQLQELLAAREQEHRAEQSRRYAPDSREIQDMIAREVTKSESLHNREMQSQQCKVDLLTKQYTELEDEFRMALEIESRRFSELQTAFEKVSKENVENNGAYLEATKDEQKNREMISELTSLAKEQKGRITELSKSKAEQLMEFKERVQTLESHLEEARRRMVQLELLKKEKIKLTSQVHAQESVIEGLKSERKLWGEELAHQGASLAQDRGRLDAKIEASNSECNSLRRQLDIEADSVRIKTKMIEDQTETIRKLKEGLLERDAEIKKLRDEIVKSQNDFDDQLATETSAVTQIQEKYERMKERKEELKQQVADLEDQLEDSKTAHGALNNKWREKSSLITQLEGQVMQMKSTWEAKEKRISEERDKAVRAATLAVDKLKSMDDAFRKQLDSKEQNHRQAMETLTIEKQEEIDMANKRVIQVEEEMRELLRETEANKRAMEDRVKRLNKAFSDLQQDLI